MASVSELVQDVAEVMGERVETVNAYARALIDSGDLPKSRGRAVATVSIEHIGKLFVAVALSPKIKDTAETLSTYWGLTLPRGGPTPYATAGDWIVAMIGTIYGKPSCEEDKLFRKDMLDQKIHLIETWPQIEIHDKDGEVIARFQEQYDPFWKAKYMRLSVIHCRAFIMLGNKRGADYVQWGAPE